MFAKIEFWVLIECPDKTYDVSVHSVFDICIPNIRETKWDKRALHKPFLTSNLWQHLTRIMSLINFSLLLWTRWSFFLLPCRHGCLPCRYGCYGCVDLHCRLTLGQFGVNQLIPFQLPSLVIPRSCICTTPGSNDISSDATTAHNHVGFWIHKESNKISVNTTIPYQAFYQFGSNNEPHSQMFFLRITILIIFSLCKSFREAEKQP